METYIVDDPESIRLLGSPIRQDIVDQLDAAGASTLAQLAAQLGRPADALYYHVRLLREAGLLVERDRGDGRGMVVDLPAASLAIRYRPEDPDAVMAIRDAIGTMLRSVERRFGNALEGEAGEIDVEGSARNLWATRVRGRLTEADREEVNALIRRLHDVFRRGRGRPAAEGRLHEVNVVICPLPDATRPRPAG